MKPRQVARAVIVLAVLTAPVIGRAEAGADDPSPACVAVGGAPEPVAGAAGCTDESTTTTQPPGTQPSPEPETSPPTSAPASFLPTPDALPSLTQSMLAEPSIADPLPDPAPAANEAVPAALLAVAGAQTQRSGPAETLLGLVGLGATAAALVFAARRARAASVEP